MTWIQTERGRAFDLMHPTAEMVDFAEMANALARLARFTGHVGCGPYSIAQHSVLGADAVYADTGDAEAAGVFLLHDGHEYVLGDKATPIAQAEAATAETLMPGAGRVVIAMQRLLKQRIDLAIYRAAGLSDTGCPAAHRDLVKHYEIRMLRTERDQLLGRGPVAWHDEIERAAPIRLTGKLTVWSWPKAADAFAERLDRYLPNRLPTEPPPRPAPTTAARRLTPLEA